MKSNNVKQSAKQTRIFYVLEELQRRKEPFNKSNYEWYRRANDPKYEEILDHFVSIEEMNKRFHDWQLKGEKESDEELEELVISSEEEAKEIERKNTIRLEKISNYILGKESPGSDIELEKLKIMLSNTPKAGNTFLNMMVYRQIERLAKLVDSLELAESRMYSDEVLGKLPPERLFYIVEQINKSIHNTIQFIDKISNRDLEEKNRGNNITVNQINLGNTTKNQTNSEISKPTREMLRSLGEALRKKSKDSE